MDPIKKTVRVTITQEIEVQLMPDLFGGMTEAEYLAEFRTGLWPVDSMDDVIKYAARVVATGGAGGEHDGIGLVGSECIANLFPRQPDVLFNVLDEDIEEEILK